MALSDLRARAWRLVPQSVQRPLRLAASALQRWINDGGPQLGAAIAFYTMFAIAPLLVIAIALAGYVFGVEAARGQIVEQIRGMVGDTSARAIQTMIESASNKPQDGRWAGLLGVGTLLVGASGVFAQLRRALNRIGHVEQQPSAIGAFVRARLMAFALVLGFGFLAIAALLLSAMMAAVSAYLSRFFGAAQAVFGVFDVVASTLVLTVAFAALLRWLPDAPPTQRAVWAGAIVSALLFAVGKHAIGLYLGRASVSSSYGAAGSFVVFMLWVYYSAQILLFGAALAAAVDERSEADTSPARESPKQAGGG